MLRQAVKDKDVAPLVKYLFNYDLAPKQCDIVRCIAFSEHKRVSINCFTRYGKTLCVAIGIGLYILFNKNKKIALIAPEESQTSILRDYLAELIIRSPSLRKITDLERTNDVTKLKVEASKQRQTFKNGCEWRVFSAHGEAYRLMGFGANLIIKDEAGLISRTASTKIVRMLGDDAESAILVEITNPWDKDTVAFEHWTNPNWYHIHVDWKVGMQEGRVSQKHIDEVKSEISPIEFRVLYESEYPEESEDSLFKWAWIQAAQDRIPEKEFEETIIGVDVAEMGRDFTVLTKAKTDWNNYQIVEIKSWEKKDTMETVGLILGSNINKFVLLNIDGTGVGAGVADRIREIGFSANKIKVGESPYSEGFRFSNKKAEMYWCLRTLFEEGRIIIPKHQKLISELLKMKYELNSTQKIKIIDPEEKSPDYADSLALCCYVQKKAYFGIK